MLEERFEVLEHRGVLGPIGLAGLDKVGQESDDRIIIPALLGDEAMEDSLGVHKWSFNDSVSPGRDMDDMEIRRDDREGDIFPFVPFAISGNAAVIAGMSVLTITDIASPGIGCPQTVFG
jgi:hypothetical protein